MLNKLNIYPTTSIMNCQGRKNIVVVNRSQYLTFVIVITSMVARKQCLHTICCTLHCIHMPCTECVHLYNYTNISVGVPAQIMKAYSLCITTNASMHPAVQLVDLHGQQVSSNLLIHHAFFMHAIENWFDFLRYMSKLYYRVKAAVQSCYPAPHCPA